MSDSSAAAAPAAPGIDLNPIIDKVFAEIRELEQLVATKQTELQQARERLAAARGKMEMIGELQQAHAVQAQL